jgi:hypothetical protein
MSAGDAMSGTCRNCETSLSGPYCHQCGQKAVDTRMAIGNVVHEATHELLHLDGKIIQTVRTLITRPGQLTKDFLEGRRGRYITPLRLYLTFSLLFFALAAVSPSRDSMIQVKPSSGGGAAAAQSAADQAAANRVVNAVMLTFPRVMFLLMPLFALLTWIAWRKAQPFYVGHLYYAIHFHTFAFLTLSLAMLAGFLGAFGKGVGSLLFLTTMPYHFIALRRFFGESWARTILKGTLVGMVYWLMIAAAAAAIVLPEVAAMRAGQ